LIAYGLIDQYYLQGQKPVAIVNGDKISADLFLKQTRYGRYIIVRNAINLHDITQYFGDNPTVLSNYAQQLQQYAQQLFPQLAGQRFLNQMVDDVLIRQEAARSGITVSAEEVDHAIESAFGFYPDGTPTPTPTKAFIPTSTLSSLQKSLIPPTATSTITPTLIAGATLTSTVATPTSLSVSEEPTLTPAADLTPTQTATPLPSPTPFTRVAFEEQFKITINNFETDYDISEKDFRIIFESQIYRQKVMDATVGDVDCTEEQVWALHILVEDEQEANEIYARLKEGEDWGAMAADFSIDTSNKFSGGDLGWFGSGMMVPEFEQAAFELEVGETSQPIQTDFGWHIIRILGHEERPLSGNECQQLIFENFEQWLEQQREISLTEIDEYWQEIVPDEPQMPNEILEFIQQYLTLQPTPPAQP
jgi:parvulin-like peptidyl-prolyl isomerase